MGWGWEEGIRVLAPLRQKGGALGFPQAGDWGVGTSSGGRLRHGGSLRREGWRVRASACRLVGSGRREWRWNHRFLDPGLCSRAAGPGEVGHRVERGRRRRGANSRSGSLSARGHRLGAGGEWGAAFPSFWAAGAGRGRCCKVTPGS